MVVEEATEVVAEGSLAAAEELAEKWEARAAWAVWEGTRDLQHPILARGQGLAASAALTSDAGKPLCHRRVRWKIRTHSYTETRVYHSQYEFPTHIIFFASDSSF